MLWKASVAMSEKEEDDNVRKGYSALKLLKLLLTWTTFIAFCALLIIPSQRRLLDGHVHQFRRKMQMQHTIQLPSSFPRPFSSYSRMLMIYSYRGGSSGRLEGGSRDGGNDGCSSEEEETQRWIRRLRRLEDSGRLSSNLNVTNDSLQGVLKLCIFYGIPPPDETNRTDVERCMRITDALKKADIDEVEQEMKRLEIEAMEELGINLTTHQSIKFGEEEEQQLEAGGRLPTNVTDFLEKCQRELKHYNMNKCLQDNIAQASVDGWNEKARSPDDIRSPDHIAAGTPLPSSYIPDLLHNLSTASSSNIGSNKTTRPPSSFFPSTTLRDRMVQSSEARLNLIRMQRHFHNLLKNVRNHSKCEDTSRIKLEKEETAGSNSIQNKQLAREKDNSKKEKEEEAAFLRGVKDALVHYEDVASLLDLPKVHFIPDVGAHVQRCTAEIDRSVQYDKNNNGRSISSSQAQRLTRELQACERAANDASHLMERYQKVWEVLAERKAGFSSNLIHIGEALLAVEIFADFVSSSSSSSSSLSSSSSSKHPPTEGENSRSSFSFPTTALSTSGLNALLRDQIKSFDTRNITFNDTEKAVDLDTSQMMEVIFPLTERCNVRALMNASAVIGPVVYLGAADIQLRTNFTGARKILSRIFLQTSMLIQHTQRELNAAMDSYHTAKLNNLRLVMHQNALTEGLNEILNRKEGRR